MLCRNSGEAIRNPLVAIKTTQIDQDNRDILGEVIPEPEMMSGAGWLVFIRESSKLAIMFLTKIQYRMPTSSRYRVMPAMVFNGAKNVYATRCHWERPETATAAAAEGSTSETLMFFPFDRCPDKDCPCQLLESGGLLLWLLLQFSEHRAGGVGAGLSDEG